MVRKLELSIKLKKKIDKKLKMKKAKLKKGHPVFDILRQEWTEIIKVISNGYETGFTICFLDGRLSQLDKNPIYSLTEYNPWEGTGVFTPIDSEPQPQIGDMVWAWDEEGVEIVYGEYNHKRSGTTPFVVYISGEPVGYKNISPTPPDWILELIKQQTT